MLESRMICGCMVKGSRSEPQGGVHFENNGKHGSVPPNIRKASVCFPQRLAVFLQGARIMAQVQIGANQGPNSVNGGGTPIVPLDPPVLDGGAAGPLCRAVWCRASRPPLYPARSRR
jgi:hypothetical protein